MSTISKIYSLLSCNSFLFQINVVFVKRICLDQKLLIMRSSFIIHLVYQTAPINLHSQEKCLFGTLGPIKYTKNVNMSGNKELNNFWIIKTKIRIKVNYEIFFCSLTFSKNNKSNLLYILLSVKINKYNNFHQLF